MTIPFMASVPRTYNPGKGRPVEQLAFLSPDEIEMLLALTDGRAEMTPHGLPSFADDSASSKGVSRGGNGARGSGSTKTSSGTVSKSSGSYKSPGGGGGGNKNSFSQAQFSDNRPTYSVNPKPVVFKDQSRLVSSSKNQDRVPGGGSAVLTSAQDKFYDDRVPPSTIQRVAGGKGALAYSGIGHSAQPARGLEVNVTGYTPSDRSGDDYASVASRGVDYTPADRSGDDFASQIGLRRMASEGAVRPQGLGVRDSYGLSREQRRLDEKNSPPLFPAHRDQEDDFGNGIFRRFGGRDRHRSASYGSGAGGMFNV